MKTKQSNFSVLLILLSSAFWASCSLDAAIPTNYAVTTLVAPSNRVDGTGTNARFFSPVNVAVDGLGNVYVADSGNNAIRKITSNGAVTTLAGGTWGFLNRTGTNASFAGPQGVAVDGLGNVYVADSGNNAIRKITSNGAVTTLAGGTWGFSNGTGTNASFAGPQGVAVDGLGNLYVADSGNNVIRKISSTGVVTTLAGNGTQGLINGIAIHASFGWPTGVAVDGSGNVYVSEMANNAIRKIGSNGVVTTLASDLFASPESVAVDGSGYIYVADSGNNTIRKISASGIVTTIAGNGMQGFFNGIGTNSTFNNPVGLTLDKVGNVYVADCNNNAIRKVSTNSVVTTLAGAILLPGFDSPSGIQVDQLGNTYVADTWNNAVRKIGSNGVVSTLAGNGNIGLADGTGTHATFNHPNDVAIDGFGNVFVADTENNAIRKITSNGVVTTFAGNGTSGFVNSIGTNAFLSMPKSVAIDGFHNVYVADSGNNAIRKISSNGVMTTLAGNGSQGFLNGRGTNATFNYPFSVAVDSSGCVYVADKGNNAIRKIGSDGMVTTLAGNGSQGFLNGKGTNATFDWPSGVAIDGEYNIYVSDNSNSAIRKISSNGMVGTIAGNGTQGFADGIGTNAKFSVPLGIAVDGVGDVYVADYLNSAIRKLTPLYGQVSNPITFVQPSNRTYSNGATFALAATAPGGTVTFTSGNTNVITISGSTATIKRAGSSVITATQAGNSNYLASTPVAKTVTVNKAGQTITFNPTSPVAIAITKSFTLSGSSTSGLPLTYTSSATNVISISGSTATVKTKGVTSLKASQAGDANYNTATEVSKSVTVQ